MKSFILLISLILFIYSASAQQTMPDYAPPNTMEQNSPEIKGVSAQSFKTDTLQTIVGKNPSAAKIARLFSKTEYTDINPVEFIASVIRLKDAVVPALEETIFLSSPISSNVTAEAHERMMLYAILSLTEIKTDAAYNVIIRAAAQHPNAEIRGMAINALSEGFYNYTIEKERQPQKELMYIFLRNADDSTIVNYIHKPIGMIAREGLMNWIDMDLGNNIQAEISVKDGTNMKTINMRQYREDWWTSNSPKLEWNANDKKFVINVK